MDDNLDRYHQRLPWHNLIIAIMEAMIMAGLIFMVILVVLISRLFAPEFIITLLQIVPACIYATILYSKLQTGKVTDCLAEELPRGISPAITAILGGSGLLLGLSIGQFNGTDITAYTDLLKAYSLLIFAPPLLCLSFSLLVAYLSHKYAS